MKDQIDLNEARPFLLKLLPQAGKILEKYFYSENLKHTSKGGVDFATEADFAVDEFLRKKIADKFPGIPFLTEETAPKDYSAYKNEKILWVIDPLDGTSNFSRRDPHFATSIGLVRKGVSQLGVIFIPLEKKLYFAQEDQPHAVLNNKPIKVSDVAEFKKASFFCDWGYKPEERQRMLEHLAKVVTSFRQIKTLGSSVSDLASLAAGKIDSYIACGTKPWDVAASSLIIKKSGGKITTPKGEKWDVFEPDIFASNSLLHERVLKLLTQNR